MSSDEKSTHIPPSEPYLPSNIPEKSENDTNLASETSPLIPDAKDPNEGILSEEDFNEIPLWRTAIDPYGRRSMAFQRKDTGEIITATELNSDFDSDPIMSGMFRRLDMAMCFMMMEWAGDSRWLKEIARAVMLPLYFAWIWGSVCIVQWQVWRAGGPRSESGTEVEQVDGERALPRDVERGSGN